MTDSEKIKAYIAKYPQWCSELNLLRSTLNSTELTEEVKWNAPAYTFNGKILIGLGAFKNHMGIWFHQGVFLKDLHKKLVNAQEGKTKALRQWRIEKGDEIDTSIVLEYAQDAIENCLAGKEIKPTRRQGVSIPPFLKIALEKDAKFSGNFKKLSPGKQREYAEHISEAKKETTKQRRLEKCVLLINEGKGLHDKYKNC